MARRCQFKVGVEVQSKQYKLLFLPRSTLTPRGMCEPRGRKARPSHISPQCGPAHLSHSSPPTPTSARVRSQSVARNCRHLFQNRKLEKKETLLQSKADRNAIKWQEEEYLSSRLSLPLHRLMFPTQCPTQNAKPRPRGGGTGSWRWSSRCRAGALAPALSPHPSPCGRSG